MRVLQIVVVSAFVGLMPAMASAQASFRGVGGGPAPNVVRDATKVDSIVYAVGVSNGTGALWIWDGANPVSLTLLPDFGAVGGGGAFAITPGASYIAGQARGSLGSLANRITTTGLVSLNLHAAPYTPFNAPGSARAISADGSILYGVVNAGTVASPNNRTARFDVNTGTSTLVTQPAGTPNVTPATRGTSADGSVMVATSFTRSFGGSIHRYVFDTAAGTPSPVPLMTNSGGTWSRAHGISPDGNLTLAAGNSLMFPNGGMYLHDWAADTRTFLGSPNTAWMPTSFASMSSDGSVVALSLASPAANGTRYVYIRNGRGWFHLTTALSAAGINVVSAGWSNLLIMGMSPDGTLVFGQGRHDDNPQEGFVAEFPAGFLAAFDVAPVAPTDTSLIGAWIFAEGDPATAARNPGVLVLLADGNYYQIGSNHPTPALGGANGLERGRYTVEAATGAFRVATLQDTNGDAGFSSLNGDPIAAPAIVVSGDTLTYTLPGGETFVATRVTGSAGSVVGGWIGGNPSEDQSSFVLVLLNDGTYYLAEDGPVEEPDAGRSGIEKGTYAWDPATGTTTLVTTLDLDGEWGFSSFNATGDLWNLSPDGLVLSLVSPEATLALARVAAPPVSTSDGRMMGAGRIDTPQQRHHFEFRVAQIQSDDRGRLEYTVPRENGRRLHHFEATAVTSVVFSDNPGFLPGRRPRPSVDSVQFAGEGRWNGQSGHTFVAVATDQGEPGRHHDTFSLVITNSSGTVVATVNGVLDAGNIQSTRVGR